MAVSAPGSNPTIGFDRDLGCLTANLKVNTSSGEKVANVFYDAKANIFYDLDTRLPYFNLRELTLGTGLSFPGKIGDAKFMAQANKWILDRAIFNQGPQNGYKTLADYNHEMLMLTNRTKAHPEKWFLDIGAEQNRIFYSVYDRNLIRKYYKRETLNGAKTIPGSDGDLIRVESQMNHPKLVVHVSAPIDIDSLGSQYAQLKTKTPEEMLADSKSPMTDQEKKAFLDSLTLKKAEVNNYLHINATIKTSRELATASARGKNMKIDFAEKKVDRSNLLGTETGIIPSKTILAQGDSPSCLPSSCLMVLGDYAGQSRVELNASLVDQMFSNKGRVNETTLLNKVNFGGNKVNRGRKYNDVNFMAEKLQEALNSGGEKGWKAQVKGTTNETIGSAEEFFNLLGRKPDNRPAIVGFMANFNGQSGGHAMVLDKVWKNNMGEVWVKGRNPWGHSFESKFESIETSLKGGYEFSPQAGSTVTNLKFYKYWIEIEPPKDLGLGTLFNEVLP